MEISVSGSRPEPFRIGKLSAFCRRLCWAPPTPAERRSARAVISVRHRAVEGSSMAGRRRRAPTTGRSPSPSISPSGSPRSAPPPSSSDPDSHRRTAMASRRAPALRATSRRMSTPHAARRPSNSTRPERI